MMTNPTLQQSPYAHAHERTATLGNEWVECRLNLDPTPGLASLTNKHTGATYAFHSRECGLGFASGQWRNDILEWRFCPGSGDAVPYDEDLGYRNGFHLPDADIADWSQVQQLNGFPIGPPGYSAVIYPGYGWYRASFDLPSPVAGQPIEFGLGGGDNQDWNEYRVYVNGVLIGQAQPAGRWHETPRFGLNPGDEGYRALHFGEPNCLAVQARGLDRSTPEMSMPDAERYSVGSPLVDQYVAVAPAQIEVAEFHWVRHDLVRTPSTAGVDVQFTGDGGSIGLTIRYWVDAHDPVLHKQVEVRNDGAARRTLLEMDVHALAGEHPVTTGGLGLPCIVAGELYCGIRHPAGLAQGDGRAMRLRLFPGRHLEPGETYTSQVAIFGAGPAGEGSQSWLRYLERHSPRARSPRWLSFYDIYGWHDIAGIDDPTPVTESLVERSLDILADFQQRGITFDVYNIDTGWNNPDGDLRDFDAVNFPAGPAPIVKRIRELGMKFGLWVSPAAGPMAFHPDAHNPALAPCGTWPRGTSESPRGSLCMASEPWRRMFREALLFHVRENDVRNFKLDANAFFCTNPDHPHLPGKYSMQPIMDAMIDTLETVRRACPDILFMYYWGISSPWWLLHGHTLYERGVLMEGATPSDFPSPLLRQSVTTSFDQAAHHAWDTVPLPSHDSLGVWISDTRWGNWMGRAGWQDAWIMDIARGSGLTQLWGDLTQFDEGDIDFLAHTTAWLRQNAGAMTSPRRIGGNPWAAQPYGYAYPQGDRAIVFAYNPQYRPASIVLHGQDIGIPVCGSHAQTGFVVHLQPFEVSLLQIDGSTGNVADILRELRPARAAQLDTQSVACLLEEVSRQELDWDDSETRWSLRRAVNGRAQYVDTDEAFQRARLRSDERDRRVCRLEFAGHASLPPANGAVYRAAALDFVVKLSRDGMAWHHHALFDIVQLSAGIDGQAVPATHLPHRWHEQAGGWSWILFRLVLEPGALPARIQLNLRACLPASVDARFEAWLCLEERT